MSAHGMSVLGTGTNSQNQHLSTGYDVCSGDRYFGNDRYSGLKNPDDAILFTVSGITAVAGKKLEILIKRLTF